MTRARRRKAFDVLDSAGGALILIVLRVAGSLMLVSYNLADSKVHSQLAEQQITSPVNQLVSKKAPKRLSLNLH